MKIKTSKFRKEELRGYCTDYLMWWEESKITFEKEFPGLVGKGSVYVTVDENGKETKKQHMFFDDVISKHCLDKKRVVDIVTKYIGKEQTDCNRCEGYMVSIEGTHAFNILEELGLSYFLEDSKRKEGTKMTDDETKVEPEEVKEEAKEEAPVEDKAEPEAEAPVDENTTAAEPEEAKPEEEKKED